MKQVLDRALEEVLAAVNRPARLSCEDPLRVAAATLRQGLDGGITATTVVGVLGLDDVVAFEALVARISDQFSLDARVRMHVGSFSVRFSAPGRPPERPAH